jgi:hypothetical protein
MFVGEDPNVNAVKYGLNRVSLLSTNVGLVQG